MNKVVLLGRLSKDPEIRYSQAAEPMCIARYTLAVSRRFKREGEPDADFIQCVAFGKQGEFIERFFKKGMQIAISGRITVRSWDDPQGQRRWSTEVVADEQEFTESKAAFEGRGGGGNSGGSSRNYPDAPMQSMPPDGFAAISETLDSDDIP
ncbi:MAG: single-stranded DNA-binding protein, partial [Defluviitaleaceae bacterium]|nr:single-stranded DNA-binding protein [Defluviitaleaceae bacterium]